MMMMMRGAHPVPTGERAIEKYVFFFFFFLNFALWHMGKEKCIVSVNSLYGYLSALYWTRLKELRGN